jgi:hypothetical protein
MDRFTKDKLNLGPRSDEELHSVLSNFELKWQHKARRVQDARINRF